MTNDSHDNEMNDIEALQLLVAFNLSAEQFQDAEVALQQLISLEPNNPDYYNNLGEIRLQMGQLDGAIECFQTALKLDPFATEFIDNLLLQLTQSDQRETVIKIALSALQVNPVWTSGFLHVGNICQKQGDFAAARDCIFGLIPDRLIQAFLPKGDLPKQPKNYVANASYSQVFDGEEVLLPTPKSNQENVSVNFGPRLIPVPPAYIVSLNDGRVWSDPYTRAVLTSNDELVEKASVGNATLIARSSAHLPDPARFQGTLAPLTIRFSHNYFHWMYDLIPKLEVLEQANISLSEIDAFLVNHCQYPFQREMLHLMGVPDEQILDDAVCHAIADRLIVPISSFDQKGRIAKHTCDFLRKKLLPNISLTDATYPTRFYISRKGAKYRKVLNEDEVLAHLQPFGFVEIVLETFSVQSQIALFSKAEIIIAPHGAGLSNLVFASPGVKLIEIFLPDDTPSYYQLLSGHLEIDYYYFLADTSELSVQVDDSKSITISAPTHSLVVQPQALLEALKYAGIT